MRRPNDFYPTPTWGTECMLDALPFDFAPSANIWEPCAGAGDIAKVIDGINHLNFHPVTNDIDPQHDVDYHLDATLRSTWEDIADEHGQPDWVITNPPFNAAHHILPLAMEYSTKGVIALLRLSYSEPCENRSRWLYDNQERQSILYLPRRISFTGDGATDNVATAWFIWGKAERLAPPFIYPRVEVEQMGLAV
jgi:hypothetical protein